MRKFLIGLTIPIAMALTACGGGGSSSASMAVTSSSWTNGGAIPVKYSSTQNAANTSPALTITNVPQAASFISVVMDDETLPCGTGTNACPHWAVINLPATKVSIAEGEDLSGIGTAVFGQNYTTQIGYAGPNPPSVHTYKITVYAHKTASTFTTGDFITRADFITERGSDIVDHTDWTGIYTP